jgi:hypothetical protein
MALAGRTSDHAIKAAGGRMKVFHVSTPEQIGTAHHAKALLLESAVKESDPWEKRQNQVHRGQSSARGSAAAVSVFAAASAAWWSRKARVSRIMGTTWRRERPRVWVPLWLQL